MQAQPYLDRRGILMEQLQKGLIFVPGQGPEGVNPSLFYLTGIDEPRAALLLAPAGTRIETGRLYPGPDYVRGRIVQQILFLPARNPLAAAWGEDSAATVEEVRPEDAGVDAVIGVDQLHDVLAQAFQSASLLHHVRAHAPSLGPGDDPDSTFASRVRRRFLNLQVRDGAPHVDEMRRVKDDVEVAAIERALEITRDGLDRVLSVLRPGIEECEIEAEITRAYRRRGGRHAFDPIVGSGANALRLHYKENHGSVGTGELLLVDTGARIDGYCSDISRTFPTTGRFSARQREVYEVVLRAQQAAIDAARPGVLLGDLHAVAWETIDRAGLAAHFIHGLGHYLGVQTHDAGDVYRPLEPGVVITVEPGVYIGDEGIGVRIEDDVLITRDGCRVLGPEIPKDPDAIERRMQEAAAGPDAP